MSRQDSLREHFRDHEPERYQDIVKAVVENIRDISTYRDFRENSLDPDRITEIEPGDDDDSFLLYVIVGEGYNSNDFYTVLVEYGSCSVCDTLQKLQCEDDLDIRIDGYMTLALHIV